MRKTIKILYPMIHYPPVIGGIEQWAENIAKRHPENIEVIVITGGVGGKPDIENNGGVPVIRTSLFALKDLSHSSRIYILTAFPFVLWKSILAARKRRVDLVHCHGFLSAFIGLIASWASGIDFIGTEQSVGWANSKTAFLRRFVYSRARTCIASSRAVEEEYKKIGVKSENIKVIPNGVDLAKFTHVGRPTSHISRTGKEFNILSVGRLEKVKGHEYLINAFVDIKKQIPDAKLVIIGGGPLAKDLRLKISNLSLGDSVELKGEIAHDDLPQYYAQADVFVMPSLSEGFGITAVEAMAAGAPVVASRVGGLADIIENNKTGLLIEPASTTAIKEAVCFLKDNPEKAEELSKNALIRAKEYSWDNIARRVSDLYISASAKHRSLTAKILFITSIFPPDVGGPAVYAEKLRDGLVSIGYEADVLKGGESRSFFAILRKAKNSGIVYALTSSPRILFPSFVACKILNKKIAVRLGGDYIWERAVENRKADFSLSKFYEEGRLTIRERVVARLLGGMLKRVDAVIFTTKFQKDIYRKYYNIKECRVSVIENAYPAYINSASKVFPAEPLRILYAGRIIRLKNLSVLISAFSKLKKNRSENIALEIVGEGPGVQSLMEQARNWGASEYVTFEASLPQEKILEKLERAWIAVSPSYSEVSPNFVLEACAAKTPVIVTKECGLSEEIMNKLLTFDPFDESSLVQAMEKMLDRGEWKNYRDILADLDLSRDYATVAREHDRLFNFQFSMTNFQ